MNATIHPLPDQLVIDPMRMQLECDGRTSRLTAAHLRLLLTMLGEAPPGEPIDTGLLARRLWGDESAVVSAVNSLSAAATSLNSMLGFRLIESVPRVGRRLPVGISYAIRLPSGMLARLDGCGWEIRP